MGEASSRITKSQHKEKAKEFIKVFNKKQPKNMFDLQTSSNQAQKQWLKQNLQPGVKLKISSSGNLPKKDQKCKNFLQYYQIFAKSDHTIQFKEFQDVEYLSNCFEIIKFKCKLDNKYNVICKIWIVIKDGKIYQIDMNQEYTGPSSFDVTWKTQFQKYKNIDTPQTRAKYAYNEKRTYVQNSQSSNGYYEKPIDWNAHYNAQVSRSNQQFRQNMNKQATEWNNYAQQKANRGW